MKYEEQTFTNDFLFCKILENNESLCKQLVELLTGKKVEKIEYRSRQKDMKLTEKGKGIRLDVFVENDDTVFDVEMQVERKKNLPKRSRYYLSTMDSYTMTQGVDYSKLKTCYIIFICMKSPFKAGLHKYTFKSICDEDPTVCLKDDAYRIFVTPDGTADDMTEDMKSFLSYLVDGIPRDEFTETIDDAVEQAKLCDEWRKEFMTLEMRDWEKREEGREEGIVIGIEKGREEGREEGIVIGCEKGREEGTNETKAKIIMTMLSKGFSEETLLDLDFSASEIQAAKEAMA